MREQLLLEGRSGCGIEFISKQGQVQLRKYAKDIHYNERLIKQKDKQESFLISQHLPANFYAPKVSAYCEGTKKALAWFDMQYIFGEKYSAFFARVPISKIDAIIKLFIDYFTRSFRASRQQQLSSNVFIQKINQVKAVCRPEIINDNVVKAAFHFLENEIPDVPVPLNDCHGDFTFSNMIFSDEKIYLVDFLDSFVDSPLIDLVKLRQDTRLHWTIHIDNSIQPHKKIKLLQILKYFDDKLLNFLYKHEELIPWYQYLEKLNLVRILPYLKLNEDMEFVMRALKR